MTVAERSVLLTGTPLTQNQTNFLVVQYKYLVLLFLVD